MKRTVGRDLLQTERERERVYVCVLFVSDTKPV